MLKNCPFCYPHDAHHSQTRPYHYYGSMDESAITKNFGSAYTSQTHTVGEALIEILKKLSVERIYGIGGDYVATFIQALDSDFELIACGNELHSAFAACAEAEIQGLGITFCTYTVGSLPILSAAALAKTEGLPVVFISGSPSPLEMNQQGLHHMVHSSNSWNRDENHALRAFASLDIRSERLLWPCNADQPTIANQQFLDLILHAIKYRQPVFIEIPRGLLNQKCQKINAVEKIKKEQENSDHLIGAEVIAQEIHERLQKSHSPLLLIGERIKYNPKLRDLVLDLCEKHNIPFATNLFAKGIYDEHHPLSLGCYNGLLGSKKSHGYIQNKADYIIEICTSILMQDTSTAFGTGTYLVHQFKNKTTLRGTDGSCQDVLKVFEFLKNKAKKIYDDPTPEKPVAELNDPDLLSFANIAQAINQIQSDYTEAFIYLPEVGNSFFSSFSLKCRGSHLKRSWLTNPYYAAMGTSLPYAHAISLNAKLSNYQDIPVVLIGDGGFHFQSNELASIQRDDLFMIILFFRNNIFHLGKLSSSPVYNCHHENLNLEKITSGYGGKYTLANNLQGLKQAFAQALATKKGIHFVEIPVSTDKEQQSPEIQIINTYIQSRSGDKIAQAEWEQLCHRFN